MKYRITIMTVSILALNILFTVGLSAQEHFKSDVHKEYDEQGNITRFDSCWTWSFRSGSGYDFDSVFNKLFGEEWNESFLHTDRFPLFADSGWNFHFGFGFPDSGQTMEPFYIFPDHLFEGIPFPIPGDFDQGFHDSIFMQPFQGMYFDDYEIHDFFRLFHFPDCEEIFRDHMDRMDEYFHLYRFPKDTIQYYHPWKQSLPGDQQNQNRGIEL